MLSKGMVEYNMDRSYKASASSVPVYQLAVVQEVVLVRRMVWVGLGNKGGKALRRSVGQKRGGLRHLHRMRPTKDRNLEKT
jgi:hypothetical protein